MNFTVKKRETYHEKYGKCYTFDAKTIAAIKNLYRTIIDDPDTLVTSITGMPSTGAKSEDAFVLLISNLSHM